LTRPAVSPHLASILALCALEVHGAPRTGAKRLAAEGRMGDVLVAINGVPLGFQGPLNPDGEPYPLRHPDGSPDLGRFTDRIVTEFTPDGAGWLPWLGARRYPVPPGTLVDVRHRDGGEHLGQPVGEDLSAAEDWGWSLDEAEQPNRGDIVAWRLSA